MYARTFGAATLGVDGLIISVEVKADLQRQLSQTENNIFRRQQDFSSSVDVTI